MLPILKVNEIFYSLQGEGARSGTANIFIRLSGCNLSCSFCDTNYIKFTPMSLPAILDKIKKYPCDWILWTGGEPTLQLNNKIIAWFKNIGYRQAIETNGILPIPDGIDYVVVSPKKGTVLCDNLKEVDEIRLLFFKGDKLPDKKVFPKASYHFISPVDNPKDKAYYINVIKKNPEWRLSTQAHKEWGIR